MKPVAHSLFILLVACVACSGSKQKEEAATDSLNTEGSLIAQDTIIEPESPDTKQAELTYDIKGFSDIVYGPYDFALDADSLKDLLGSEVKSTVEEFDDGNGSSYSITTVTFRESKISFYNFPGKHSADIYTPLLSVANGVKVGFSRAAFFEKFNLSGDSARVANIFYITDDYGNIKFSFKGDNLYNIFVLYEEGD